VLKVCGEPSITLLRPEVRGGERSADVATVRASCPTCGDVELTTRDVLVRVDSSTGSNSYSFPCPTCRLLVSKAATDRIMEILVGAGVRVVAYTRPAELDERKSGPPITHDELLGFHIALDEPGWLEREIARLGRGSRTP
jgi:hypothetical protein